MSAPLSRVATIVIVLAAATSALLMAPAHAVALSTASGDWTTYLGSNARTGYNAAETSITPQSAARLALRWHIQPGGHTAPPISSQPLVEDRTIYFGGWDGMVRAVTLSGRHLWQRAVGLATDPSCNPTSVGVANTGTVATATVGGGERRVLFIGGGDTSFYAIDATTGQVLWRTVLGAPSQAFLWSSPALYNDSIYEGVASLGDCPLVQGKLVQMDARTGAIQHVFSAVPRDCTGGAIWASPAIDETHGTVFIVTGNPGDCAQSEPYTASMVALRASDLHVQGSWSVPPDQQVPDDDFGATPTLFTAPASAHSSSRELVGASNKNGIFYAFSRSAVGVGPIWQTRISDGGSCPQCGSGGIAPASWDGTRMYIGGGATTIGGTACEGSIQALDAATGAPIWKKCVGLVLGAITTVPGVVEAGAGARLVVLNSSTGRLLFQYSPGAGAPFYGAGSISNGLLVQGDSAGNLYAFGVKG